MNTQDATFQKKLIHQSVALKQAYFKNPHQHFDSDSFKETLRLVEEVQLSHFAIPQKFPTEITEGSIYLENGLRVSLFFIPQGKKMRLHDHPNMYVICKILKGRLIRDLYSLLDRRYQAQIPKSYVSHLSQGTLDQMCFPKVKAIKKSDVVQVDDIDLVTPENNLHTFEALENSIFFDVIAPDYDDVDIFLNTYVEVGQLDGNVVELQMGAPVLEDNKTIPISFC